MKKLFVLVVVALIFSILTAGTGKKTIYTQYDIVEFNPDSLVINRADLIVWGTFTVISADTADTATISTAVVVAESVVISIDTVTVSISIDTTGSGISYYEIPDLYNLNFGVSCNDISTGASYSGIFAGKCDTIVSGADYCFIGGGENNEISGAKDHSAIVGGKGNLIHEGYSFMGGGLNNTSEDYYSAIIGGSENHITAGWSGIFCGRKDTIDAGTASYAVAIGGYRNRLNTTNTHSAIVGGQYNDTHAADVFIGAGIYNKIASTAGIRSGIIGGQYNEINEQDCFIGGGFYNYITGRKSAIVAGQRDTILVSPCSFATGSRCVIAGATTDSANVVIGMHSIIDTCCGSFAMNTHLSNADSTMAISKQLWVREGDDTLKVTSTTISNVGKITFIEDADRTGEGTCMFANGMPIGMTTPGDCQGMKMEFDYGVAPTLTGGGKVIQGLMLKMTMDQRWKFASANRNADVRGAGIQAELNDSLGGVLEAIYANAYTDIAANKQIIGEHTTGAYGVGMCAVEARTEIKGAGTLTVPHIAGLYILHRRMGAGGVTGDYHAIHIENSQNTGAISGTETGIHFEPNTMAPPGANFDYGIDMNAVSFGTADFRLSSGATIANPNDNTLTITEANINLGGTVIQETNVIRKFVSLSGATDNVATNIFTITTTNETGSADGGMYSVKVHLTAGEATAASGAVNTASVSLVAHWTRIMASAGTGVNSAIVELSESASADEGTGAISAVTLTVTETSEFVQQVLLQVNTSGGTFDGFALVELVYSDFTTAPVIE